MKSLEPLSFKPCPKCLGTGNPTVYSGLFPNTVSGHSEKHLLFSKPNIICPICEGSGNIPLNGLEIALQSWNSLQVKQQV